MFDLFAHTSEGMMLVDRQARVVWVNEQYKRFLPALGFDRVEDFVGHPVASVVQNTQMHHVLETGKPILIDLLTNRAGTFVVSRIPLRDNLGEVIGAYTGADRKGRDGKFRLADGGTLFLDEIGDMPLGLQAKLLRALQEGEIEPLGSNKLIPFDARVIPATSRDLGKLVRDGFFREDLFYRLNVPPIPVPPLRERREDIPALVELLGEDMALRSDSNLILL